MKLSEFKTDPQKEVEGVRYDFDETSYIVVARANNKKFLAEIRKGMKDLRRRYRKNVPDELATTVVQTAFAKHILLEINGFVDDHGDIVGKGENIENTYENRLKISRSESYKDFVDFVSDLSADPDMFREDEEDELGKSPESLNGDSPGEIKRIGSAAPK